MISARRRWSDALVCFLMAGVVVPTKCQLQGNNDNNETDVVLAIDPTEPELNSTVTLETDAPTLFDDTPAPTPTPKASITGELFLELRPTPSLLTGSSENVFLMATRDFLNDALPLLEVTEVEILSQKRQPIIINQDENDGGRLLQNGAPLFLQLGVSGLKPLTKEQIQQDVTVDRDFDFSGALEDVVVESSDEYSDMLVNTGDLYFVILQSASLQTVTDPPTSSPTLAVATTPLGPIGSLDNQNDRADKPRLLSLPSIIGIAVGGAILLTLLLLLCCRMMTLNSKKTNSGAKSSGIPIALSGQDASRRAFSGDQEEEVPVPPTSSDLESQGLYSYAPNDSFAGSQSLNGSMMGASTMSYAYSLEAGIEPSVAQSDSMRSGQRQLPAVPLEIPQLQLQGSKPSVQRAAPRNDGFDTLEVSDMKLTKSELAMLPSNLARSNSDQSVAREVTAPPGKLGIVIDTTVNGPVVHSVNDNSALRGKVKPGDVITAIDNVDTRAMSAAAITALMVKTANQHRRLTIVSSET